MKKLSKRQARRMKRPRARATAALRRKKARPAGAVDAAAAAAAESARMETTSRRTPRSRRTMGWRSSPKSAATSSTPSGEGDAFDRRGPRGDEERRRRPRGSRGERSRFRRTDGEGGPRRARPASIRLPSLALEEDFAASEADYSPAPRPATPPHDAVAHEETMAEPAPGPPSVRLRPRRGAERRQRGAESSSPPRRRRPSRPALEAPESAASVRAATTPPQRLVAAGAGDRHRELELRGRGGSAVERDETEVLDRGETGSARRPRAPRQGALAIGEGPVGR